MYYNVSVAPCNAPYWTRKLFSWHLLTFTCKSHFQKSEFVKAKSDSAKNVRVQTVLCEVPNAAVLWGEPTLRMSMRRLHLTKFDWRLELEHLNAIKTNPPVQEVEKNDSSLKRQRPGDHTGPFDLQRWADHRGVVASPLSAADTYPITRSKDGPCPVRYESIQNTKSTTRLTHSCSTPAPPRQCCLPQTRSSGHFQLSNDPAICKSKCWITGLTCPAPCWDFIVAAGMLFAFFTVRLFSLPRNNHHAKSPGKLVKVRKSKVHICTSKGIDPPPRQYPCVCCRRTW